VTVVDFVVVVVAVAVFVDVVVVVVVVTFVPHEDNTTDVTISKLKPSHKKPFFIVLVLLFLKSLFLAFCCNSL
jgi:hypothetical protein